MTSFNGLLAAPLNIASATATETINPTTPLKNLFDDRPRRLTESESANLTLDIDMGARTNFNLVAVLFTNAAADATMTIRIAPKKAGLARASALFEGALWASPSGARHTRRHGFAHMRDISYRWLRIEIRGGAIAGGRLQVGRIVIAKALQPGWNYALGSTVARQPLIDQKRSRTGQVSRRLWQQRRVLGIRFPELTEEELYSGLMPIAEHADARPVLIIQDPAKGDFAMEKIFYGELVTQVQKAAPDEYDARLQLTEWT